jgi:molybdenum cofactor cytidylyltransferase
MQEAAHVAAIILAAGTSSRMGATRNKLLLPLRDRPVVAHVIEATLHAQLQPVILVLGHQAGEVKAQLAPYIKDQPVTIVENPDYAQGMSTSMQAGLRTLAAQRHTLQPCVDGVMFLLGDQPLVSAALLDRLLAYRQETGKRVVQPLYQGQRGNPVIFSLELLDELMQVRGDEGGRSVLKRHADELATIEMGEVDASLDVDTWEAYLQVQRLWEAQQHGNV